MAATTRPRTRKRKKSATKTRGAKPARLRKKAAKKAAGPAKPRAAAKLKKSARKRVRTARARPARKAASASRRRPLATAGRRLQSSPPKRIARARVTLRRRGARVIARGPRIRGVVVAASFEARHAGLLTPAALRFLADLHRRFCAPRERLLASCTAACAWETVEEQLTVDREPIASALLEFGLHAFHNADTIAAGSALPFGLPAVSSADEARLWRDVLTFAQESFELPGSTIRVTVPAGLPQDVRDVLHGHIVAPVG